MWGTVRHWSGGPAGATGPAPSWEPQDSETLGLPCEPGPPRTGHRVIGWVTLPECQAKTPRTLLGEPRGPCGHPLTAAALGKHFLTCSAQVCVGLDTGVTRPSALLGLWPWGEEQAHGVPCLSGHANDLCPQTRSRGRTRPSAQTQLAHRAGQGLLTAVRSCLTEPLPPSVGTVHVPGQGTGLSMSDGRTGA